jgi:hypothetical protein
MGLPLEVKVEDVVPRHWSMTLRSVVGQIVRDVRNVHYFPSYEIFTFSESARWEDGRHVNQNVLDLITSSFIAAFRAD